MNNLRIKDKISCDLNQFNRQSLKMFAGINEDWLNRYNSNQKLG